jgi:putative transposase
MPHRIYSYLLRGLVIERSQVWAMATTYIPLQRGFVYRTAVLDWATPHILAWRVSNSLTCDAWVEALRRAASLRRAREHDYRPGQPVNRRRVQQRA